MVPMTDAAGLPLPPPVTAQDEPGAIVEARSLETATQLRDHLIGQREVVEVLAARSAEVPGRDASRGAIVNTGRPRHRQVEQDQSEAGIGCGANGEIAELGDSLGGQAAGVGGRRETGPLVDKAQAERVSPRLLPSRRGSPVGSSE